MSEKETVGAQQYRVSLEDPYGTCWTEQVTADSADEAMQIAENEAPGSGSATAYRAEVDR